MYSQRTALLATATIAAAAIATTAATTIAAIATIRTTRATIVDFGARIVIGPGSWTKALRRAPAHNKLTAPAGRAAKVHRRGAQVVPACEGSVGGLDLGGTLSCTREKLLGLEMESDRAVAQLPKLFPGESERETLARAVVSAKC